MRDLRSLGARLRALHARAPPPPMPRFDPMVAARRYADLIVRGDPPRRARIQCLFERGAEALAAFGLGAARRRASCTCDLHHGNVLTADRVYFIDWEYAQVGDPLLDLACIMAYYPRAVAHGALLLKASGLEERGATAAMLAELTSVFTLLTYLWYRARRVSPHRARHRSAARIHRPAPPACAGARRPNLGTLAPRICANLRVRLRGMATLQVIDRDGVSHDVEASRGSK